MKTPGQPSADAESDRQAALPTIQIINPEQVERTLGSAANFSAMGSSSAFHLGRGQASPANPTVGWPRGGSSSNYLVKDAMPSSSDASSRSLAAYLGGSSLASLSASRESAGQTDRASLRETGSLWLTLEAGQDSAGQDMAAQRVVAEAPSAAGTGAAERTEAEKAAAESAAAAAEAAAAANRAVAEEVAAVRDAAERVASKRAAEEIAASQKIWMDRKASEAEARRRVASGVEEYLETLRLLDARSQARNERLSGLLKKAECMLMA